MINKKVRDDGLISRLKGFISNNLFFMSAMISYLTKVKKKTGRNKN